MFTLGIPECLRVLIDESDDGLQVLRRKRLLLLVLFGNFFILNDKGLLDANILKVTHVDHFGEVGVEVRMNQGRLLMSH